MKISSPYLIICLLLMNLCVFAQETTSKLADDVFYSVQLGNFNEALKQSDFESIRSYAYVYKRNNTVFIGGFKTVEDAQALLEKVKARGFDDAQVVQRPLTADKTVFVVQVATSNAGELVPFATYARFGKLYTAPYNNLVRLVVGYYTDKNDARIKLNDIFAAGYKDAFIKAVKLPQLNAVSDFDTGGSNAIVVTKTPSIQNNPQDGIPKEYSTVVVADRRKSVIKLQETLRKLGTFNGEPDGKYGSITDAAYAEALQRNKTLATAHTVAQKNYESNDFDDATTLLVLAQLLATTPENDVIKFDALNNLPEAPLAKDDADAILNWHTNIWKKLEQWSLTSKVATRDYDALKVAYYKTLTHLEQMMYERKMKGEVATAAALSVMKALSNGYLSKID